jgi:Ca2+/Na+ antiporter
MKIKWYHLAYIIGMVIVVTVLVVEFLHFSIPHNILAVTDLIGGVMLIAGACEFFVLSVEGIAHHRHMTDYVSGIYASIASTIPEIALIYFLIARGQFEMAWVLALATIFMNSIVFSLYTLILPKDQMGNYKMPDAIMWVGSDLLSMGAVISLAVGLAMLVLETLGGVHVLTPDELLVFGACLLAVFIAYLYNITKYYGKRIPTEADNTANAPHVEGDHGHGNVSKQGLVLLLILAALGAMLGGEALAEFANFAKSSEGLGLNFIQGALLLVIFAGTPEYIIVASTHRKNKFDIALSNAFGGIVQVFFVVFSATLLMIGLFGGEIPIDLFSVVLLFFAYPSLFILRVKITDDAKVNNLEAIAMIALFIMMLYMLLRFPPTLPP